MRRSSPPSMKKTKEKPATRTHARAEMPGRVILHNEEQIFIAPLENISAGGLFINHVIQLQVGTEVRLVVKSPKMGVSVQAVGQVVRVENEARKGSAIVFTTISEVAQQMINACVFEAKLEHSAASGTRRDA